MYQMPLLHYVVLLVRKNYNKYIASGHKYQNYVYVRKGDVIQTINVFISNYRNLAYIPTCFPVGSEELKILNVLSNI